MIESESLRRWVGHAVHDPSGRRIGDLIQVYVDGNGEPRWLVVKRGTMTVRSDLVPASAARIGARGLTIDYDQRIIHESPRVADRRNITSEGAQGLVAHDQVADRS